MVIVVDRCCYLDMVVSSGLAVGTTKVALYCFFYSVLFNIDGKEEPILLTLKVPFIRSAETGETAAATPPPPPLPPPPCSPESSTSSGRKC